VNHTTGLIRRLAVGRFRRALFPLPEAGSGIPRPRGLVLWFISWPTARKTNAGPDESAGS
ncbi:hypothetical protein, partial [Arthrobacter sp. KK5.5]|uniref:hypothetical protein n=1 Tax=Arthrobacter sp. KK5.5 TaxID=3373084 RepID=UPI003EE46A12